MKNIFKEAHKMTREIKKEYKEVDYKTQFGICVSYLLNNKEEEVMKQYLMEIEDYDTKTYDVKEELKALGFEWSHRGSFCKGWNFVGNVKQVLSLADKIDEIGGLLMSASAWDSENNVKLKGFDEPISKGFDKKELMTVLKRIR